METIIGKSYLTKIPHEGRKISFQYPAFRGTNGSLGSVAEAIDKAGAKRPTSPETASLVYEVWKNPEKKDYSRIISILKDDWLYEFTGNLYLPKSNEEVNNGVILDLASQNLKFTDRGLIMDKNSLIKRLKENDQLVKFVPFGYKIGEQTPKELSNNNYIIKRYGKEGAEKIAEVASKYKNEPYVYSFNSVDEEKIRMSASFRSWFGDRLNIYSNYWYLCTHGLAFGVCKNQEQILKNQ